MTPEQKEYIRSLERAHEYLTDTLKSHFAACGLEKQDMKIYVQDNGKYGCLIVIANSKEEARNKMAKYHNAYEEYGSIEEHEITQDFEFVNYGDR